MLRLTVLLIFLAPSFAGAQVVFTSPLPDGILQVHGDHADLRVHVTLTGYSNFSYKLSSDIDTSSFQEGWDSITAQNGIVDMLLTVPKSLVNYALYWRTGLSLTTDTGGVVANLTPGHIIGIAGQSNAVGWVWPSPGQFVAVALGDIRMLISDTTWQHAEEPTDGVAQGPWIEMANELYAQIGDSLPIGIVNTAVGGTGLTVSVDSMGRWLKNSPSSPDTMYPDAIDRFRHAGSELDCFTWIQGEADGEGAALYDPEVYRTQFDTLIHDFWSDLQDSFPVFHLQISGYSGSISGAGTYPEAREALRVLPPSTLVGTAVGRSLWDTAFHYTVSTYQAVGRMFAGAVLKELYGISASMYPPLMPDTVATLDSITDGSILGRYCFSIGWKRDGIPVKLTSLTPLQYFGLNDGLLPLDTSLVWYRISPHDSTRIQIGLRNDSITSLLLKNYWYVTYDDIADGEHAPLATIDPISGDTIFATTFYELPVQLTAGPPADVKEFDLQFASPNPTNNAIQCYVLSYKHETMTIDVVNNLGLTLRHQTVTVEEGEQIIPISTEGLSSGNYWIVLRDENGNQSVQKAIFIH
jgi:hypothetical protein